MLASQLLHEHEAVLFIEYIRIHFVLTIHMSFCSLSSCAVVPKTLLITYHALITCTIMLTIITYTRGDYWLKYNNNHLQQYLTCTCKCGFFCEHLLETVLERLSSTFFQTSYVRTLWDKCRCCAGVVDVLIGQFCTVSLAVICAHWHLSHCCLHVGHHWRHSHLFGHPGNHGPVHLPLGHGHL